MSVEPRAENQKLFDWKRSGSYAWKACFPLTRVDRVTRSAAAGPESPALAVKPIESQPPVAPQGGKP